MESPATLCCKLISFTCICTLLLFGLYPQLMALGEGRNVDWPVNQQFHTQRSLHHCRSICEYPNPLFPHPWTKKDIKSTPTVIPWGMDFAHIMSTAPLRPCTAHVNVKALCKVFSSTFQRISARLRSGLWGGQSCSLNHSLTHESRHCHLGILCVDLIDVTFWV